MSLLIHYLIRLLIIKYVSSFATIIISLKATKNRSTVVPENLCDLLIVFFVKPFLLQIKHAKSL